MFETVLQQIRSKVRALEYVMTVHADDEMNDDGLSILDVEQVILNGAIIERQRDHHSGEWKYLINGQTEDLLDVIVVVKLGPSQWLVIITIYVQ